MSAKEEITLTVNGKEERVLIETRKTLSYLLREVLGLTGTKEGCGEGECGACTVLLDGKAVNSCMVLAVTAQGKEVLTVEGLAQGEKLHPLQRAFIEEGAVQCGFCTPGMLLTAKALLDRNPNPTEEEIKRSISGNICRCTGYQSIIRAIQGASKMLKEEVG